MSLIKYRISDMAKDFGVPTKDITALVTEFYEKPKSGQQVLTEEQLNVLFDVMTQRHQIESIEQVFAVAPAPKAEEPKKEEAPKAEEAEKKASELIEETIPSNISDDEFNEIIDMLKNRRKAEAAKNTTQFF